MRCFYPINSGGVVRPCGQCQACLINKQQSWKFRLSKEVQYSDIAFWLTLQYDDEHLPRSNGVPCVCKIHCQDYFRQLRKYFKRHDYPIIFRYFLVSEYGSHTNRPHYHSLMLFRFTRDISLSQKLKYKKELYDILFERWYHGFVKEKPFHDGVVRYLTKYVFKPQSDFDPPVKNFRLISNGIGADMLKELNPDQLVRDCWKHPHGLVPRYYRDKLFPLKTGVYDKNRITREDVFSRQLDKIYSKSLREFRECGSIEAYNKKQDYLTNSQRTLVERKYKNKYE